MLKMEKVT